MRIIFCDYVQIFSRCYLISYNLLESLRFSALSNGGRRDRSDIDQFESIVGGVGRLLIKLKPRDVLWCNMICCMGVCFVIDLHLIGIKERRRCVAVILFSSVNTVPVVSRLGGALTS